MKKLKFLGIGLACLVGITSLKAESFNVFSTAGTAVNTGTNYAIIPGEGFLNAGNTVVTFLSCRVLCTAGGTLQSYYSTNKTYIVNTNGYTPSLPNLGSTTNYVASTNGLAANTICVLSHLNPANYRQADEYVVVSSFPAPILTTNALGNVLTALPVVFTTAPVWPVNPGDILYQETAGASISIANQGVITPTTLTGPGILEGGKQKPFLLVLSSAANATNTIDSATASNQ